MADKHYIITKDKVEAALDSTSELPVQNKVIKSALDNKLDSTNYAVADEGKVPKVTLKDGTYQLVLSAISGGTQSDWSQTTTTELDYIKNKPFQAVGAGLTVSEISGVKTLTATNSLHFEIMDTLPAADAKYKDTIALVLHTAGGTVYDEFACVLETGSTAWKWEQIGDTTASVEQTDKSATSGSYIKVGGVVLQSADTTHTGLLTHANFDTFNGKQEKIGGDTAGTVITNSGTAGTVGKLAVDTTPTSASTNLITSGAVYTAVDAKQTKALVTAFNSTTLDTNYPSEKLVKDSLDDKVSFAATSESKAFTIGKDNNGYYIEE